MASFAAQVYGRDVQAQDDKRKMQLAPLQQAIAADQQRLSTMKEGTPEYESTVQNMALNIGRVRNVYGDKTPADHPGRLVQTVDAIRSHLGLGGKNPQAGQDAKLAKFNAGNTQMAQEYATGGLPFAQTPEGQKASYQRQTEEELARIRNEGGATSYKNFKLKDGTIVTIDTRHQIPPPGAVLVGSSTGYIRQSNHVVMPADAISLMHSTGAQYPKQSGGNWTAEEIAKFPKGTVLAGFVEGDRMFYAPFDQHTKTAVINNMVTQIPEAGEIAAGNENPLGASRVPTVTTHQVPGMNPGEKLTLTNVSTPQTGAPGSPSAASSPAPPPAQVHHAPSGPAHQRLQAHAALERGEMPPEPPPFAKGTFLTQGKTVQPVVASMRVVGAQVFGGNGQPPIWDYAHFYDNPDLGKALNKALTMNSLSMPGVRAEPGLWETLATSAGVTGWSQQQINDAAVSARNDVQQLGGEDAMKFLSRLMGFQEDLSALRTATRASAAQGSIQTLVRAAPIYNVSSAQNFRDQLATTLNTASAAMSGYPVINPQFVQWFSHGARLAEGGKESHQPKFQVGQKVKLKDGKTITVKHVYADGSFD